MVIIFIMCMKDKNAETNQDNPNEPNGSNEQIEPFDAYKYLENVTQERQRKVNIEIQKTITTQKLIKEFLENPPKHPLLDNEEIKSRIPADLAINLYDSYIKSMIFLMSKT